MFPGRGRRRVTRRRWGICTDGFRGWTCTGARWRRCTGTRSGRWGPALDSAIGRFVTQYGPTAPASRDFAEVFQLLGDPSLSLPMPPLPNYLILTPPDFANTSALNQLIASRQARGFNVITHTVSSGTTNTALKTYVHSLWGTANSPKYVVIIGDTAGSTSTSNTIPHFVGLGYRQGTTDWPYVCMDTGDDWYPEIPIGRLSVQNTSQLQAVVGQDGEGGVGPFQ